MGLSKTIKTSRQLWNLFIAYKTAVKKKPRFRYVMAQKTGRMVKEKLEVPLTKEGFYNFVANQGFVITLKDYFSNREKRYEDFVPICSRIREEIVQDQIEGGMVGQYNASITQRLNNLAEKQESRHVDKEGNDLPQAPPTIQVFNTGPPLGEIEEEAP